MIRAGRSLVINPAFVSYMKWDRGEYSYGPRSTRLIIGMSDGTKHEIEHNPHALDGTDCYAIEAAFLAWVDACL